MKINMTGKRFLWVVFVLIIIVCSHAQYSVLKDTYRLAEKYYSQGSYKDALPLFSQVFIQSSDKDLRAKAIYMKALCEYKLGDYSPAAVDFSDFMKMFPDHPLYFRAALYLGNCYYKLGSYLKSAQAYGIALLSRDARERHQAAKSFNDLLWGYLPTESFPALLDVVDHSLEGMVGVWWLRRLQHDGEHARALREGRKLLQRLYTPEDKSMLQEELTKVENYLKKHLVVALLVPQSGDYESYGRQVINGAKLAFSKQGITSVELKVIDSGGEPLRAAIAINDLLKTTTPLCIIGPITSDETAATGVIAGTYKVPLITPTASKDGIAELSPYVFQLLASPVKSSYYIGKFAASQPENDTFAILAPDDELGHNCAEAFSKAIIEAGKKIIAYKFYPTNTFDFSPFLAQIKEPILKFYDRYITRFPKGDPRFYDCKPDQPVEDCPLKERKDWSVHIDGLFLPAYYDEIEIILPQVPFMYINTTIFGANGWVVDDLSKNRKLAKYLDGATLIPDDFYIDPSYDKWRKFAREYKSAYGRYPSRVAALGYDAAMLVINGINSGALTQELMRDFLSGVYDYNGAAGPVSFDQNGANTKAFIVKFVEGKPVRIK